MREIILALAFTFACATANAREIALTFDDAPTPDTSLMTADERVAAVLAALREANVEQVAFFAVPRGLAAQDEERLRAFAKAGHLIANHSNTHRNLRNMTAEEYIADIVAADRTLSTLPNFRAWFRFPFLSEGETREKRDAVRSALHGMHYEQGYVTIDNYDWYLNKLANDAKRAGKEIDETALRDLYVETLMRAVDFYDAIAVETLSRSPRHVILLHENDLAARYLGDFIAALRDDGWRIISPELAYRDAIAAIEPDTLFLGQGRVAAIANTQGVERKDLVEEREDEAVLDKLFEERVLRTRSH